MMNFKKDYADICIHKEALLEELKKIEKDPKVKRYIDLKKQTDLLENMQVKLYRSIKFDEYSSCKHLLVYSKIENDKRIGRTHKYCGCIKCGLNDFVLTKKNDELLFEEKVMKEYLKDHHMLFLPGKQLNVACDLSLATNIYSKIKMNKPNIDDETSGIYFKRSLAYIRKEKINKSRKISRAKRLSLRPDFDSWYSCDLEK